MAGSKSDYLENELLDHCLSAATWTAPATVYIALFTARGTDAQSDANTNFTEVSGGAYARKDVTNNVANWPVASGGAKANGTVITFATATASWGTVIAFGIYDALAAGNLLYWATLTANKTIDSGDTAQFAIGDLDVTED